MATMSTTSSRNRGFLHRTWVRILWLARHEGRVLAVLAAVALGIWGFIAIAGEVVEGDTRTFDEWLIRSMRRADDPGKAIGPHWMQTAALDATALGGTLVLVLMITLVALFLLLDGKRHAMWLVLAAAGGGQMLSGLMKYLFSRPRPQVVPHLDEVQTASFPSGHSMMSAVVYLTLGAIVAQVVSKRRVRVYVLSVAIFLTLMIGMTRVYLGVHYPTDVLAGWTAGLVWALLCWTVATRLQKQGTIEAPGETTEDLPDRHDHPTTTVEPQG